MKKLISVLLILALALSVCAPVLAEQEYDANIMANLQVTVEEATVDEAHCAVVMAVTAIDLVLDDAEVGTIAQTGTGYMKAAGNCIEAYILREDDQYVGVVYNADTKKYTYSGVVSLPSDLSAYKTVPMDQVYADILYVVQMLMGEDE